MPSIELVTILPTALFVMPIHSSLLALRPAKGLLCLRATVYNRQTLGGTSAEIDVFHIFPFDSRLIA